MIFELWFYAACGGFMIGAAVILYWFFSWFDGLEEAEGVMRNHDDGMI